MGVVTSPDPSDVGDTGSFKKPASASRLEKCHSCPLAVLTSTSRQLLVPSRRSRQTRNKNEL